MAKAPKGEAPRKPSSGSAKPASGAKGAPAGESTAEVSSTSIPQLPPFWVEWGRAVSEKWPVPVFVLALVAGAVLFLTKPREEPRRSPQEYVRIARKAYDLAVTAQDERGELSRAIDLLAGRNVRGLAEALKIDDPYGVHGVLPSYERARIVAPGFSLEAEDLAISGEARYRLAEIKREHADGIGRRIRVAADVLYRKAIDQLSSACASAPAAGDARIWHARRRVIAECHARLGEYPEALAVIGGLIEAMAADQAQRLRREKDPRHPVSDDSARQSAGDWARVYELAGRCHDSLGQSAEAAKYYRLFLGVGEGGSSTQRIRVRLSELAMDEASAQEKLAEGHREEGYRAKSLDERKRFEEESRLCLQKARESLEEVCRLCAQVEQSDASAELREKAVFMLGRGQFRLGGMEADAKAARSHYEAAVRAFRHPFTPRDGRLDASRVLLGRSLFLAGRSEEAEEVLKGVLRMGSDPAISACAEVGLSDLLAESDPRRALNGDAERGSGYLGAVKLISRLSEGGVAGLVPEAAELLAEGHFVARDPESKVKLAAGDGQLLRIARWYVANRDYDQAERIYRHILDSYRPPAILPDRYRFLLGELLSEKADRLAERLARQNKAEAEVRKEVDPVRVASAREFMKAAGPVAGGSEAAGATEGASGPQAQSPSEAWWRAGAQYFSARRFDGASVAYGLFAGNARNDARLAEALYYQGESLRRMGAFEEAVKVFKEGSIAHSASHFGYLSELSLGETYLEMGRLDAAPGEGSSEARDNARAVFDSIRHDARYTPDSQVWMQALFLLGETHYRLGRRGLAAALEERIAGQDERDAARAGQHLAAAEQAGSAARKHLETAAEILDEAVERYPLAKYRGVRPSFEQFLRRMRMPVMRMRAMICFDLGQLDRAAERFGGIIQVAGQVSDLDRDRTEAEDCLREAYSYKGLAEVRGGHLDAASETFRLAYEEFGRRSEGPAFAQARASVLELSGRGQEAALWYGKAADGYAERLKSESQPNGGQPRSGGAASRWEGILPAGVWREHALWAGK